MVGRDSAQPGGGGRALGLGFLAALLLLLPPALADAAGPVTVESLLSASTITVGDQVILQIQVTHDPQVKVDFPDLFDRLGNVEVLRRDPPSTAETAEGLQTSTVEYTVTGFVPGQYRLPTIAVQYTHPDGTHGTAETGGQLSLEVVPLVPEPEAVPLRDIKPPTALERPAASLLQPATMAALAGAMAGLGIIALRQRRRSVQPAVLPADPATAARSELRDVARLALITPDDYALYYGLISVSVRGYLDARFRFDARSSTTTEIGQTMERRGMDRWQARIVAGLLEECDTVRWAHYRPDPARAGRALTNAFEVISLTSGEQEEVPAPALRM